MNHATLCIGADVHLDEIVLCAVDKADGHQVADRFPVTNRLRRARCAGCGNDHRRAGYALGLHARRDRLGSDWYAVDPFPPLPE